MNVNQLAEGVSLASGSDIRMVEGFDINDSPVGTIIISKDGTINRVAENGDGKILEKLDSLEFTINDGKDSFIIKVSKDGGITMNDVVKEINSTKDVGVRASYDANIGRFFLQTIGTGKDAKIEIGVTKTDELGNIIEDKIAKEFFEGLKLNVNYFKYDSEGNAEKIISEKFEISNSHNYQGSNAIIDFNGATGIEYESNRITINGITMDLASAGEFTINVATDVDGVYEKIEQFINDYNELVDKTNKLLGEKVYRDNRPLTADQRKAMEKEDIELWEEKAKSGLLRNDDIIGRTMLNIRRSYINSDEFNGSFKLITEIGISTEQYSRGSAGNCNK